jgi:rhamnulose-1-phosphate aldolase
MKNLFNNELADISNQLAEIAGLLYQQGWAESSGGNISINVTDYLKNTDPDTLSGTSETIHFETAYPNLCNQWLLVTLSGSKARHIAKHPLPNIALIAITDNSRECRCFIDDSAATPNQKPTSELLSHLAIHNLMIREKQSVKVIMHAHVTELIALSHNPAFRSADAINQILWSVHPEVKIFLPKGLGFVPYTLPGSAAIARKTIDILRDHEIIIWEKHGAFAVGDTLENTFDIIDIAAKAAKIYLLCKQAGYEPEGLTESQIRELAESFKVPY